MREGGGGSETQDSSRDVNLGLMMSCFCQLELP